ncbi:MAG: diguanylate cyclase, partial [Cloacibacillus sp.]
MFAALYAFSSVINRDQAKLGRERLREITAQSTSYVNMIVTREIKTMDLISQRLAKVEDIRSKEALELLKTLAVDSDFDRLALDFESGESYTSDGYIVDVSDLAYIKEIPKGNTIITDLVAAKIDGRLTVSIISPIIKQGKVVGAARGTIYTENYGKVLNVDVFGGEGYFHLLNGKGEYLAASDSKNAMLMDENYFDALTKLTYDNGYSAQRIKDDFKRGAAGTTAYSYNGRSRYAEYRPVGVSDWYLVVMAPKKVIDANADAIRRDLYIFVVIFSAIFFALLAFFIGTMKRSADKIKKMNDELLADENRYLVLLEHSDKVIFEFSFATHSIDYSDKFMEVFGYEPTTEGLPESIIANKDIHPDDAEKIHSVFERVENGAPSSSTELRIRSAKGGYIWCYIMLATIFSENGIPVRALGMMENIDPQKRKEQALITKAEKDELTGLYNKATTERLIRDFLRDTDIAAMHALLIIDIDNFKLVNDRLGHMYGDVVLATLAQCLMPIFRVNDVIGRIGGDEFFVFMKNISSENIAFTKAETICGLFRRTYCENNVSCQISASIGIAIFPSHGVGFEALYNNAD